MNNKYFDILNVIESIEHLSMEAIRKELNNLCISDLNNTQALILYNVGHQMEEAGALSSRKIYHGANISYNVKKMVRWGYIQQIPSEHDRRSFYLQLTEKGREMLVILDKLCNEQSTRLASGLKNGKTLDVLYSHLQDVETVLRQRNALK